MVPDFLMNELQNHRIARKTVSAEREIHFAPCIGENEEKRL